MCSKSCGWQATEKPEIRVGFSSSGWQTTEKSIIKRRMNICYGNVVSPFFIRRNMKYNNEVKLQQAFNVVVKEFENYKKNLINKSVLVIYRMIKSYPFLN